MEPTGCIEEIFAIIWSADDNKLYGLNSSGPAPKNISIDKLLAKNLEQIPPYGPACNSSGGCGRLERTS